MTDNLQRKFKRQQAQKAFADYLDAVLKSKCLYATNVSVLAGYGPNYIENILHRDAYISPAGAKRLAKVLEIDPTEFLRHAGFTSPNDCEPVKSSLFVADKDEILLVKKYGQLSEKQKALILQTIECLLEKRR